MRVEVYLKPCLHTKLFGPNCIGIDPTDGGKGAANSSPSFKSLSNPN